MSKKQSRPNEKKLKGLEHFAESAHEAHSDVLGSYTGDPFSDDTPVQDADDL